MKIIQFKRDQKTATTESTPNLTAGELYIYPQTNSQKIRIGTNESGSTTEYFEIKAKPSCLYNNTGVAQNTIVGLQPSPSNGNIQYKQLNSDGTLSNWIDLSANVSTTAASAQKLVTSGSSGYSVGGNFAPVYFQNGVPKKCFDNMSYDALGGTSLLTFNANGFTNYNKDIGQHNKPLWYKKNSGFTPVDGISVTDVTATNVDATNISSSDAEITGSLRLSNNTFQTKSNQLLATNISGYVKVVSSKGDSSTPVYIDTNGEPQTCDNIKANQLNSSRDYSVRTMSVSALAGSGSNTINNYHAKLSQGLYAICVENYIYIIEIQNDNSVKKSSAVKNGLNISHLTYQCSSSGTSATWKFYESNGGSAITAANISLADLDVSNSHYITYCRKIG